MLDKLKWWKTKTLAQVEPNSDDIPDPDNLQFSISYMLDNDDQIYIDVSTTTTEYNTHDLATLLQYSSSLQGQLDTLEVLKQGMDSKAHESFLGHFLARKTKEAERKAYTVEK